MLTRPNSLLVPHVKVMDGSKAPRISCSVCGSDTPHRNGWFLVAENCWFDRLRIFRWNPSLAARQGYKGACCRDHLKALIGFWLHRSNLRFFVEDSPMPPAAGVSRGANHDPWDAVPPENWQLLGEISVYRESFSREWTGSPEALDAMLEVLIPMNPEEPKTVAFQHLPRLQESSLGIFSP
jgi:hypothetical protein